MAIALVTSPPVTAVQTGDPLSYSFTAGAGSNLLVSTITTLNSTTVTAVRYGGAAGTLMTVLGGIVGVGPTATYLAYLYNPTLNTALDVWWDMSASTTGRIAASSYSDADPAFTALLGTSNASGATQVVDITPTVPGGLIIAAVSSRSDNAYSSFGTDQIVLTNHDDGTSCSASTYELNAAAGLNTQSFVNSQSDVYAIAAAYFASQADSELGQIVTARGGSGVGIGW